MEIIVVGAAANIFSEAEKGIFHDAKRHVRYVIFYQKTVDKFDEKLKTLAAKNMCGARCRCRKEEQGEDKSRYPGMEPQREWTRGFDEEKFHDTFTKCHNVVDE
ncbi:hypothetical protein V6N12_065941 [Hibiscus sabdariffa]|uniref:Uncharacterized protein n=1 Tax=Hibiscus sabdariffa TaxID=183260 RepID=A0ABR1ZTS0_9ROSI